MSNQQIVSLNTEDDGTITVYYFGLKAGLIQPCRDHQNRPLYKALRLADNEIRNVGTIEAAREHCLGVV